MKTFYLSVILIVSLYLSACDRDDVVTPTPVTGTAAEGAYILSEGGFSAGSSRLSFYNLANGFFNESLFNPGSLGLVPDGMILNNNNLYITEQGNFGAAGKIFKADTNGTVILSNSVGTNPYSLTTANGKLYVTNGTANNVSVVDKNSLTTITTINVGIFPQEILALGNKVFVCNTSVFGGATDSTVSVIDATADVVTATIKVRQTPSSLAITNDMKLLVGCPGAPALGIIYKIDPNNYSILDSFVIDNGFAVSGFGKDIAVDANSNNIYFISNTNNIVRLNLTTKAASLVISNPNTTTDYFYGYNYDSKNVRHYVADAKNFLVNGSLYVYDGGGVLLGTYTTGIAPRRIVLKN